MFDYYKNADNYIDVPELMDIFKEQNLSDAYIVKIKQAIDKDDN